jgi:predicted TIM-barrel fold metal-dependent hydrolase
MNSLRNFSLVTRIAAACLALTLGAGSALAQSSVPFQLYDAHVHFVSENQEKYPLRSDAAPNEHERDMREYIRNNPTYSDRILGLWDANGVDAGVAVQYRTAYDTNNAYVLDSAEKNPARVASVVILAADNPATPDLLRAMVKTRHASGIRMTGSKDKVSGEFPWLDSEAAQKTWKVADELGIAVVLMPGPVYQVNPEAMERIGKLADKFPNTYIVLDHFTWPAPEGAPNFGLSPGHLALKTHKNIFYKFTTLNSLTLEKAHVPSADFLRHAVDVYGADHVMWGSDTGNNKLEYSELVRRGVEATAQLNPVEQRATLRETGKAVFVAGGRGAKP